MRAKLAFAIDQAKVLAYNGGMREKSLHDIAMTEPEWRGS